MFRSCLNVVLDEERNDDENCIKKRENRGYCC